MFPINDNAPSRGFPIINISLIIFTCYVFYLQLINPDAFTTMYALVPDQINFANPSTLVPFITAIFLHGGWLHILSNMWFLWIFGDNVESEVGHISYLLLYLVSGIVGNMTQYLTAPHSSIPMLGASGAIAGVLGAYFLFFPQYKVKTFIPIFGFFTIANVSASIMLGYWFILQIFSGVLSLPGSGTDQGGVAFLAHVGGFVTGLLIGRLFARTEKNVLEGQVI